ncbi:phage portal protein [Brevibacillus sp. DP1.3A]|uniref:phage portal protein n=1 Tax=Brevibacillus sp. DP1.3A TaxID=2738867 RepID=UPI0021029D07|nr:phage portal protein [Brevibacillus sp. DP1.3A]
MDFGTSYIASNPIRYSANEAGADVEEYVKKVQAVLMTNDEESLSYDIIEDASIDGEVFEYYYFDEDGQICITKFKADDCILCMTPQLRRKLITIIRYYTVTDATKNTKTMLVEVYDEEEITYLRQGGSALVLDTINKAVTGKVDVQEYFKNPKVLFKELALYDLILYDSEGNLITDVEKKKQYLANMWSTSQILVGGKAVPIAGICRTSTKKTRSID